MSEKRSCQTTAAFLTLWCEIRIGSKERVNKITDEFTSNRSYVRLCKCIVHARSWSSSSDFRPSAISIS